MYRCSVQDQEDGREEGIDSWAGEAWSVAMVRDGAGSVKVGKSSDVFVTVASSNAPTLGEIS